MDFTIARRRLIEQVLKPAGINDKRLIRVMGRLQRHLFVEEGFASQAYGDNALPIGFKQTISKPSVVAKMLQGAGLRLQDTVLEIGTGSAYQTAILSPLVRRVYSVEIFTHFLDRARPILAKLDCCNVTLHRAQEGILGLPEHAPFDVIISGAHFPTIPQELIQQLNPQGGRLVTPVTEGREQRIKLLIRNGDHHHQLDLGLCIFVPILERRAAQKVRTC